MVKRVSFPNVLLVIFRIYLAAVFMAAFVPNLNPARVSGMINRSASLFTNAISYSNIGSNFVRALDRGWVTSQTLFVTYIGALVCGLAIVLIAAAFCLCFGNNRMRRLGLIFSSAASLVGFAGASLLLTAYNLFSNTSNPDRVEPLFPMGIWVFFGLFALTLLLSAALWFTLPKADKNEKYELAPKYRLFLMLLPFLVLVALFSYLPLMGWRYAFYDYRAGFPLTWDNFVGFKWFTYLVNNPATRANIMRVMTNTFAMSGLGLAFSWLPLAFAVFLSEMRSNKYKRVVQTFTTIPNFISWVLVYSVAFAIFSTEGFLNWALMNLGLIEEGANHLISSSNMWIKMFAWGTWKGLGWGAIIYLASISSIDPMLYEAATVDGAGRFSKMWHVTVPGLLPTFFVLLLLSISNILNNGLEQYLAFQNPLNKGSIEVLDLYIYNLGLGNTGGGSSIPIATLIGILKSVISVTLLFCANSASKFLRGETII
ncbi:MAG: ABC transporter permease subunit [Oscillospiraceae bacterium]|nr:ABC transporter permease subunit [Oscillospiraceae bacterium]